MLYVARRCIFSESHKRILGGGDGFHGTRSDDMERNAVSVIDDGFAVFDRERLFAKLERCFISMSKPVFC